MQAEAHACVAFEAGADGVWSGADVSDARDEGESAAVRARIERHAGNEYQRS